MKKKIIALTAAAVLTFAGCGKKSMSDGLGNGGGNITGDSKSAFKYVSYLYSPVYGKELNDQVLNDASYANYKTDVQNALNVSLKFPLPGASGKSTRSFRSAPANWYDSMPAGFNLEAYNGDVAKAMEAFLKTEAGKAYVQLVLTQYNTDLTKIQEYIDNNTYNTPEKDQLSTVFQGAEVAMMFASGNYAMGTITGLSMLAGMGGSSEMQAIFNILKDIHTKLVNIEKKIDIIDSKISDLADKEAYLDITNALVMIESIYNQLNQNKTDENQQKQIVYDYIYAGGTANYENQFNKAFSAAQYVQYLVTNYDKAPKILVKGVSSNQGSGSVTYSIPTPLYYMHAKDAISNTCGKTRFDCGMALEEIAVMKRLSLTRLSLLAVKYSGTELLAKRKDMANADLLAYVNKIKANLLYLSDSNNTIGKYVSAQDYQPYSERVNKINPPFYVFAYSASDSNRNQTYYQELWSRSPSEDYRLTAKNFLQESLLYAIENNSQDNKIKSTFHDYIVAAMALVADWEIQLQAHIKAAE